MHGADHKSDGEVITKPAVFIFRSHDAGPSTRHFLCDSRDFRRICFYKVYIQDSWLYQVGVGVGSGTFRGSYFCGNKKCITFPHVGPRVPFFRGAGGGGMTVCIGRTMGRRWVRFPRQPSFVNFSLCVLVRIILIIYSAHTSQDRNITLGMGSGYRTFERGVQLWGSPALGPVFKNLHRGPKRYSATGYSSNTH